MLAADSLIHLSWARRLSTLVVITDADGALAVEAVGPEATEINVGLRHVHVGKQQPQTEDWLGENVEDGVGNDLTVDIDVARAVSDTPDTSFD